MDEDQEKQWRERSEDVLSGRKEWRMVHPKATVRESEDAASARMRRREAQRVQGSAVARSQRSCSQRPEEAHLRCRVCDLRRHERGEHTRTVQGKGGNDITRKRASGTCPLYGAGLFPPG